MPLSHNGRLVSRLAEKLWKSLLRTVERISIAHETVEVAVLARLDHSPARTADGIRHVAAGEFHPLVGDSVEVRGRHPRRVIGAQCLLAMIIGKDEENIRPLFLFGMTETDCKNEQEEGFSKDHGRWFTPVGISKQS